MSDHAEQHYEEIIHNSEQQRNRGQIVDVDEETTQLVIMTVLDKRLAIPGCYVRELMPVGDIVYIPGTSELFLGVILVRGEIVSVLHLAQLLGLTTTVAPRTPTHRVLMVVKEEMNTGILVNAVVDIVHIPKSAIQPQASTLDQQLVRLTEGEILFDTEPVPIINVTALFGHLQEVCT